jgi:SAM-dependent methyltransferase
VRTIPLTACPVCGSPDGEPVDLGAGADAHRRCRTCAAVRASAYGDPDEVFVDGYFDAGASTGVDTTHPRMQRALADICARRLALVEGVIGGRPGRLLDVGSGSGELLRAAEARGWDAVGVEPMDEAVARGRAQGLDVRAGLLADAGLPADSFDVACALHVLEHVPDARAFLRSLRDAVRVGGHVVVEVPNLASELRARTLGGWMHLRPLEHLTQFTPHTLRRALATSGLELETLLTPSWLLAQHTLAEALEVLGRPSWERWLGPVSPERVIPEADGLAGRVPRAPMPA